MSVGIRVDPGAVYDYAANPENLPKWARGLCTSIVKIGDSWYGDGRAGVLKIELVERNHLGILDHVVTLPSGQRLMVPMRVAPADGGSEVTLTVSQANGMSDAEFVRDVALAQEDLDALKKVLEK